MIDLIEENLKHIKAELLDNFFLSLIKNNPAKDIQ